MNEQEQEVFNRRSDELAKARAALDVERAKHNTMARALSQVLLDSLAFEARANRAEKTLATLQENAAECPACNSSWDAQERAEEDAFALRAQVVALEGEVARLKREARRPPVAKSGIGDTLKRIADALGNSPLHNVDDIVQTVMALRAAASNVERDNLAKYERIRELEIKTLRMRHEARADANALCTMLSVARERIAELEDDLHEREDEAALVLSMGRELRTDADGTTGQSSERQRCAAYYLDRYREVLAEVEESADAGPVNVDANGSEV